MLPFVFRIRYKIEHWKKAEKEKTNIPIATRSYCIKCVNVFVVKHSNEWALPIEGFWFITMHIHMHINILHERMLSSRYKSSLFLWDFHSLQQITSSLMNASFPCCMCHNVICTNMRISVLKTLQLWSLSFNQCNYLLLHQWPFWRLFSMGKQDTWSKFPDIHTYFGQNVQIVGFHNGTHFKPNVEIKCCRLLCTQPIDKTMYYKSRRHTHSYRKQILRIKCSFITFSLDTQQDSIDNGIKTFSTQRKSHQKNKK